MKMAKSSRSLLSPIKKKVKKLSKKNVPNWPERPPLRQPSNLNGKKNFPSS